MSRKLGYPPLHHIPCECSEYEYRHDLMTEGDAPCPRGRWWRNLLVGALWCAVAFLAGVAAFAVGTALIAALGCE